jgi:metal-responsive CopG/Arc/MetJ family transcriptional regulator
VKTAISMPDETFAEVERHAHEMGVSRSEFMTRAARRYMGELDIAHLTNRINVVVDIVDADESSFDAVAAGHARLAELATDEDDAW